MAEMYERWRKYRDEKNAVNHQIGALIFDRPLSEEEAMQESCLLRRYNELYEQMYSLQEQFIDEDWAAYETEQEEIRETERQSWLIANRYGNPNPPGGIAD